MDEMDSLTNPDILQKLKEITAVAEKSEEVINKIKRNLEDIKRKPQITEEDAGELRRNHDLLRNEFLNQAMLTQQLEALTIGKRCVADVTVSSAVKSCCPPCQAVDNEIFLPTTLVYGHADDIIPRVIVWNQEIKKEDQ